MAKSKFVTIFLFTVLICISALFPLRAAGDASVSVAGGTEDSEKKDQDQQGSRNVNVDMQLAYGQYNNMLSVISLSHEQDDFAYLLTSNFKRSNDYGYNGSTFFNTSYYENKIGFTGNLNVTDAWKTLFEVAVDDDSHGMYDNEMYTREEKEKYSLSVKNIIRSSSTLEWYSLLDFTGYDHRLDGRTDSDNETSSLDKFKGEFGWEYVWSGSNRIKGSIQGAYYDYSAEKDWLTGQSIKNDAYVRGEILDDFHFGSDAGISAGIVSCWNRDSGMLALAEPFGTPVPLNPFLCVTYTGSKYVVMSASYKYDMENFSPENLFFAQNYVRPQYNLPSSRYHAGEAKVDINAADLFSLKNSVLLKKTDNFYNYAPAPTGNVLMVDCMNAVSLDAKTDATLSILGSGFQLSSGYEYQWFHSSQVVTYHPSHSVNIGLKYSTQKWNVEWSNKFSSSVYTGTVDSETGEQKTLPSTIIGVISFQMQLVSGLFAYLRVENLYNNKYYLTEGYPESGITIMAGLRILI